MDFPNGMSKNMLLIAKIEAERRASGSKSYGNYVKNNDVSHLSAPRESANKVVCTICGAPIFQPPNGKRKYCDECQLKMRRKHQCKKN